MKNKHDLPREKLMKFGASSLSDSELLAIILQTGSKGETVFELSKRILEELYTIQELVGVTYHELLKIKGIKASKATKLIASIELSKRMFHSNFERKKLVEPNQIFEYVRYDFYGKNQEELLVLFLNVKCELITKRVVAIGHLTGVQLDAKSIFSYALKYQAYAIVLVHNHPSGNPEPSVADITMTKKILEAGALLNITVLDHIIVGDNRYYSFQEQHIMEE